MNIEETITRRQAIGAGAATALGAALALAGCSAQDSAVPSSAGDDSSDHEGAFLPLGSVVTLDDGLDPEVERIIIARRPVYLQADEVYDYAAVVHPIGFISDVASAPLENEVHLFDASAIREVRHVGYAGALEGEADKRLADARAQGTSALEALLPLAMQMGVIEATEADDAR